ncbi:MAG: acetyltransferase [Frankiales bacterium]|nr:acetyltransferase [Frankiales bacterium]
MLTWTPAGPPDADDVLALFRVFDAVEYGAPQTEATDVAPPLAEPTTWCTAVREQGRLVGYAHLSEDGDAESAVEPGRPELHRALLSAVLRQAQERGVGHLVHWSGPRADGPVAGPLTDTGFRPARTVWRLCRSHDGDLPFQPWPEGVVLRPLVVDRDLIEVHALVQRAFAGSPGSHPRTLEQWVASSFPDGSDAVCVVREGHLLGVATTSNRLGEGFVATLAVDAWARGQGLAQALLAEVFRRDVAAGLSATSLTVDGENATARRLYEGVGMTVAEEYRRWEYDAPS